MRKSWIYGAAVVVLIHATWFGLIFLESRADWFMAAIVVMQFVAMNVAGLGAFITAMTAPRRGFLLGLSIAPLSAALTVGSNLAFAALGNRVDLSGFYDNFGLLAVSLGYGLFVAAVGGGIGLWMKRRNGNGRPPAITEPPVAATSARVEPFISEPPVVPPPAGHI
ncbi:MAG TPA: hypothetical protein VFZ95_01495 [Steroidobacteraceae bacterium]